MHLAAPEPVLRAMRPPSALGLRPAAVAVAPRGEVAELALAAGQALCLDEGAALAWAAACDALHEAWCLDGEEGERERLLATARRLAASARGGRGAALFARRLAATEAARAATSPRWWKDPSWLAYEDLAEHGLGALLAVAVEGPALLAGLPAGDVAGAGRAAELCGAALQIARDATHAEEDLARGAPNALVLAQGLEAGDGELLAALRSDGAGGAAALWAPALLSRGAAAASCRARFDALAAEARGLAAGLGGGLRPVLLALHGRVAAAMRPV